MKKIIKSAAIFFILLASSACAFAADKTIYPVSGDGQTGIRGYPLKDGFIVRVAEQSGKAVSGVKVNFSVIRSINEEHRRELSSLMPADVYTDENGYARTRLSLGRNSPDEIIVVASSPDTPGNVIFKTLAFNKNWLLMTVVNLAGGLALLLFGMTFINSALQKAAGQKFRSVLSSVTSSKYKGAASGFFLTSLNQSSSATMLLTVGLVSTGLLSFYQSMSISLGASIGSTITGQLVAFRLVNYALPIMAFGYFISFVSGGKRISEFGDAIFGFGILFFGMKLMSDAMVPITLNPIFLDFIAQLQSPFFSIFAGIAITIVMQSSGAVVGMLIALAASNVLTLNQAVCLALGSQVGSCITVVLGTVNMPRNAKRTMIWQIVQQSIAVLIVFPFLRIIAVNGEGVWFVFVKWVTKNLLFTEDIGRQVAMSHTLAAIVNAVVLLPFLKYLQKFMFLVYPFKNEELAFGTVYIDIKNIEKNADKALELSKKEIQRMGEFVLDMLTHSVKALKTRNINIPVNISNKGVKIDLLNKEIVPYLVKIGQKRLSEVQSKKEVHLLYILSDLDEIADIVDRNLMHIAKKKIRSHSRFSDEGLEDIKKIHAGVCENLTKALNAFAAEDKGLAKEVADFKASVMLQETELRQKHIARLHANLQESIETSGLHMDILDQYTRINSIICDIGNAIAEDR